MTLWSHFRNLSSTRTKLAESAIWQEQTAYYCYHGIASWDNRVPYEVSNSVYFAENHADMLLALLQDCRKQGYDHPLLVVELGSSHGKFIFHVLQRLEKILPDHGYSLDDFLFHCCDCSPKMLSFWSCHPQLKPYITSGVLKPHLFHIDYHQGVECDIDFCTWQDKKLVLIANYFFDSLYQNAFVCEDNRVHALDIILPEHTKHDRRVQQLSFATDSKSSGTNFYTNPQKNGILLEHMNGVVRHFLMPDSAMDITDYFSERCQQLLLITSDKGYTGYQNVFYADNLSLNYDGALSTTVNFFALDRYFCLAHQGDSLLSEQPYHSDSVLFNTNLFLTNGRLADYPQLQRIANHILRDFPCADHHVLRRSLVETDYQSLQQLQACIRFNRFDPFDLVQLLDRFRTVLQKDEAYHPPQFQETLLALAHNCYYIPSDHAAQTFACCARLAIILRYHEHAEAFIQGHVDLFGKNYTHHFLKGELLFQKESFIEAHRYFSQALSQKSDCEETARYLDLCENAQQLS